MITDDDRPTDGQKFKRKRCGHITDDTRKVCSVCGDDYGTCSLILSDEDTGEETTEPAPPPSNIDTAKELVNSLRNAGFENVSGGGTFQNSGYVLRLELIVVSIGIDGFIEIYNRNTPGVRVGFPVQDALAALSGISALQKAGHVAKRYGPKDEG